MLGAIADKGRGGRFGFDERQVADVTIDTRIVRFGGDPAFHAGLRRELDADPAADPVAPRVGVLVAVGSAVRVRSSGRGRPGRDFPGRRKPRARPPSRLSQPVHILGQPALCQKYPDNHFIAQSARKSLPAKLNKTDDEYHLSIRRQCQANYIYGTLKRNCEFNGAQVLL